MKESLNDRQIAFMLFGAIVGFGTVGLPKNVAENAGTGGWVSLLLATGISIILTYIIVYLNYVYEHQTIYEYTELLVGKFLTTIFMLFYIVYFFLFFTMITRMASEVIKLSILAKTPIWALSFLYLAVVYYAVTRGLKGIACLFELYGIILLIGGFTAHILIFTAGKMINLQPFFVFQDLPAYIKTSLALSVPFLGMELLTIIPIDKKINKNIFKYCISMMIVIGFLYIALVESSISVIGVDDIIHYKNALIATMRRVDVPFLSFLRRLDGFLLNLWIMAVFTTITFFAYGTIFLLKKTLKITNFNLVSFVVIFIAFIVIQIPNTVDQVLNIIDFTGYLAIIAAGIIPILLLIITKVKKYDQINK